MFLRRDYPVYLWDGPRVGRANWGCDPIDYVPRYEDPRNFRSWHFGPQYKNWWPGVQVPTDNEEAWKDATRSRYDEFDTADNVQLQSDAAAFAADSGKLGDGIIYLTNSAGGLRAQMATIKSKSRNIKGMVTYESMGYVFPDNLGVVPGSGGFGPGFGPFVVPIEDFKKLAKLTAIQFVWGDNRPNNSWVAQSRRAADLINSYGGNAEVLMLGDDAGLKGSTHIPFADMDNAKFAGLLDKFLERNRLVGYVDDGKRRRKKSA